MKNAPLIKAGIIICVVIIVIFAIIGNVKKKKGDIETQSTEISTSSREEVSRNIQPPASSKGESQENRTKEYSTENIESYTIQADLPAEFPVEEPDPEEVDNMQIHIYFTNTRELDSSNLLPLTAWEKLNNQVQHYLNEKEIVVEEIRVIDGTMKKEGNIVSFESTFPDIPDSYFAVMYDLDLRQFSFSVQIPEQESEISNEIEPSSSEGIGETENE